jgi:hypothetical protein
LTDNQPTQKWWKKKKIKDIALLAILAFILLFASWKIFYTGEEKSVSTSALTDNEKKISALLQEIEGVGEASVMICETEEGVLGAVVVCEGAKNIRVNMDIREAVATALGTKESAVKIYLKKN